MKIGVDKGQKAKKHDTKHGWLEDNGYKLLDLPLPVGDYIEITEEVQSVIERRGDKLKKMDLMGAIKVSVDTKQNLNEVVGNICGKSHARFRDECILAQQNDIDLYILIEHGGKIKYLEDVQYWFNPRQIGYEKKIRKEYGIPREANFKKEIADLKVHGAKIVRGPTTGIELYKAMRTMQEKYNCKFIFTDKANCGRMIVELLKGQK